jgi:hypothetical protein
MLAQICDSVIRRYAEMSDCAGAAIGPRVARTRWANPPYELYAGTGSGSAFAAGNGLNVSAIRNAPSPTAQEPI